MPAWNRANITSCFIVYNLAYGSSSTIEMIKNINAVEVVKSLVYNDLRFYLRMPIHEGRFDNFMALSAIFSNYEKNNLYFKTCWDYHDDNDERSLIQIVNSGEFIARTKCGKKSSPFKWARALLCIVFWHKNLAVKVFNEKTTSELIAIFNGAFKVKIKGTLMLFISNEINTELSFCCVYFLLKSKNRSRKIKLFFKI